MTRSHAEAPARATLLVALDFESTGSVPGYRDEPWQLGVFPLRGGRPDASGSGEWILRVEAERPFNPCAPGAWRGARERMASARALPDLLPALGERLLGVPLVAHNAATEKRFLREAWPLQRPGPWIDTLKLARLAYPHLPSFELGTVLDQLDLGAAVAALVPGRTAHDALYDAAGCAVLLAHLLDQPGWRELTVDDLVHAATRRRR
jgi:DNA polymerase III epsilon subunit-like protein